MILSIVFFDLFLTYDTSLIIFDIKFEFVDKQTQLSPIVMCSPAGYSFKRPVILSFQHCASLKYGPWNISVLRSDCPVENTAPIWQVRF